MKIYKVWLIDVDDNIIYLDEEFDSHSIVNKYVNKNLKKYSGAYVFEVFITEKKVTYKMIDSYCN